MQKIIEIEQHLLFFIDFIRVPKYRVRPIACKSQSPQQPRIRNQLEEIVRKEKEASHDP